MNYFIETQTYRNGKIVYSQEFFSNPHLFRNYPTQHNIDSLLSHIRDNQVVGMCYCVRVYEEGTFVIESDSNSSKTYPVTFC